MPNTIYFGDNLALLRGLPDESVDLIYIDPPFNTGKVQARTQIRTVRDAAGDRVGFQGKTYRTETIGTRSYLDVFDDFMAFLQPRIIEARRILSPHGSLFFHIDYREVHYCKVLIDGIFGRECFQNEIIWAYDYGARSKSRWPAKHDTILWYSKHPERYVFNLDACDRIPYMAPGLVGAEKAARGKTPTDVWWHTIVSPTGREKTGYPTQKPIGILRRIITVHSDPGQTVMDFFAGSGTTGVAAAELGRQFILMDQNPEALAVIKMRLAGVPYTEHGSEKIPACERGRYQSPPVNVVNDSMSDEKPKARAPQQPVPVKPTAFHGMLQNAMRTRGLSTGGLAKAVGISFPAMQKILQGAHPKRATTVAAFAAFLEMSDAALRAALSEIPVPKVEVDTEGRQASLFE